MQGFVVFLRFVVLIEDPPPYIQYDTDNADYPRQEQSDHPYR